MRIGLVGTRGVPARYGGFETCAEEIGRRLAARGHEVKVYCRSALYPKRLANYEGMTLVHLPALRIRALETLSHTALSLFHAAAGADDVLLVFNLANSPLVALARLAGKRVVLHTDGLEWMRGKWPAAGRRYYRWAERLAVRLRVALVSDSAEIQKYFERVYGRRTEFIAYGAPLLESAAPDLLEPFGLRPGGYLLQMARFEPENNLDLTVEAFLGLATDKTLAIVGGSTYKTPYAEKLLAVKHPRLKFLGFVYDKDVLRELLANCYAYVHGNEVGGTNPGLLQAMGAGCFVLARDVVYNREAGGGAALYFRKDAADLRAKMAWALDCPAGLAGMKAAARKTVGERYDWEAVALAYEALFARVISAGRAGG
jgi:glycosyltransferase involved in cell wall biosynthesis